MTMKAKLWDEKFREAFVGQCCPKASEAGVECARNAAEGVPGLNLQEDLLAAISTYSWIRDHLRKKGLKPQLAALEWVRMVERICLVPDQKEKP